MARIPLSEADDWRLEDPKQDVRGWKLVDETRVTVGTIAEMIVNTDTEEVDGVVLDSGSEYPVVNLEIGDGVVRARGYKAVVAPSHVEPSQIRTIKKL